MGAWFAVMISAAPLLACSCINTATPCSGTSSSTAVFVARVIRDSGEGWGTGPARVVVEEGVSNAPKTLSEIEIETTSGTSCYYRLRAGERYVVFTSAQPNKRGRYGIGACSNTFLLHGQEHLLDAVRNAARGGASRIVGTVHRSTGRYSTEPGVEGATVKAVGPDREYTAVSGASGGFEMRNVEAGVYKLEVSKPGFLPDNKFNQRWSGRLVLDKETNSLGPDKAETPGSVVVGSRGCVDRDLSLWPNGRVSGQVTDRLGAPLSGITVQAFAFNAKGERESSPLHTAITNAEGRYTIAGLPAGSYSVGVNAEKYRDAEDYPRTVYRNSEDAARIFVPEAGEAVNIDLILPPKRLKTLLRVQILDPSGKPGAGASVEIENDRGVTRWSSRGGAPASGVVEAPVYLGERYVVRAWKTVPVRAGYQEHEFDGSTVVTVAAENPVVTLQLSAK